VRRALLLIAALIALIAATAAMASVQSGRYGGVTEQKNDVTIRVDSRGGHHFVGSFSSVLDVRCNGQNLGYRVIKPGGTVGIGQEGRAHFQSHNNTIAVGMQFTGGRVEGHIGFKTHSCQGGTSFTAKI